MGHVFHQLDSRTYTEMWGFVISIQMYYSVQILTLKNTIQNSKFKSWILGYGEAEMRNYLYM